MGSEPQKVIIDFFIFSVLKIKCSMGETIGFVIKFDLVFSFLLGPCAFVGYHEYMNKRGEYRAHLLK